MQQISQGDAVRSDATVTWQDGDPAVPVAPAFSLDDTVQPLHGAVVRLTGSLDGIREVLMYDLSGLGLLAGRPKGGPADRIDLFLFNRASARDYETALRSIRYINHAAEPTPGPRHVTVEVIDATAFSEVVLEATLDVPAPDAYEFLSPDILKGRFERLQFEAFEYAPPPALQAGQLGAFAIAAPRSADVFANGGEADGAGYLLHRHPAQADRDHAHASDAHIAAGSPDVIGDDTYLVLAAPPQEVRAMPPDSAFVGEAGYRLFRERTSEHTRPDSESLFQQRASADPDQVAVQVESVSDSAPVLVLSDSTVRRREREQTALKDAA